jgi:hypothetical protein
MRIYRKDTIWHVAGKGIHTFDRKLRIAIGDYLRSLRDEQ